MNIKKVMKTYDLVDKFCYVADCANAPFETIEAESIGKAKSKYHERYKEYPYVDILCRVRKKGSYKYHFFNVC